MTPDMLPDTDDVTHCPTFPSLATLNTTTKSNLRRTGFSTQLLSIVKVNQSRNPKVEVEVASVLLTGLFPWLAQLPFSNIPGPPAQGQHHSHEMAPLTSISSRDRALLPQASLWGQFLIENSSLRIETSQVCLNLCQVDQN